MVVTNRNRDLDTGSIPASQHPALIIVDMSNGFTSPDSPLGGDFSPEIAVTNQLIQWFAQRNWPIFCSSVVYSDAQQASVFRSRLPDLEILQKGSDWVGIDPRLEFPKGYTLVEKQLPSAFFDTNLAQQLREQGIDSCVVTGLTTSGCVRATAVDSLQYNFSTIVVSDACGDRNHQAHLASLHDINAKYGVVVNSDDLLDYIEGK